MKNNLFALIIPALLLFSCKKNNGPSAINYQLKTTNHSSPTGRAAGTMGTIVWTSGTAYATEIKFEAENNNSKVEYESKTPQQINLFAPVTGLGNITVPPGTYKEVEFEIELAGTSTIPAFELRGTYNGRPIVFRLNQPFEIEAEKNNVTIGNNNTYTAITSLDLALLTVGVTDAALSNATLTNGEIIISANSNTVIYNLMLNNLQHLEGVEMDD